MIKVDEIVDLLQEGVDGDYFELYLPEVLAIQAENEAMTTLAHGRQVLLSDFDREKARLEAENARLRELLRERDGGTHDVDCKIHRPSINRCNCGHDEVKALLNPSPTPTADEE